MSSDLDAVFHRLAETQDALVDLPAEAFEERLELRRRQEELRARVRELLRESPDTAGAEQVASRLAHLERLRDEHVGHRVGHSAGAQTGEGGGIDPGYVHEMHRRMDEAFGLAELNEEIRRLRGELRRLGRG